MHYRGQTKAVHNQKHGRIGVLLANLGTPDAPTAAAVRPYLKEFLSDPRVIEVPKWKWWPILHGVILRFRPAKSAASYRTIWTDEGSPLMAVSVDQRDKLAQKLMESDNNQVVVKLAMRYGNPAISDVLREFQEEGVNRIIVLPLYPQYSGASVASVFDAVSAELRTWRWVPELHFINTYHDHPLYIKALVDSVQQHFAEHGKPQKLLMSYHGMPQRYIDQGDPYYDFCHKTTRLVAEQLNLEESDYLTCFQSRFGVEPWLQPYTDHTLKELARTGVREVAVITPGFSADCLETIEEIAIENRDYFLEAGGETYHYIPALNAQDNHIDMMIALLEPLLK